MRTDRSAFRASGHYAPYTLSADPPALDAFVPDWLLERTVSHGLSVLALDVGLLGDLAQAQTFGQRCRAAGVELVGSVSLDLGAGEDKWAAGSMGDDSARFDFQRAGPLHTGWIGSCEMAIASAAMALAQVAGVSVLSLVHGQPGRTNRYDRSDPIQAQLMRIASNVRRLIPEADALRLTLALEPHMDYRCAELVQVVEAVASPRLRLVFDFADSLSVNEDPLEAAQRAAPYTVAAHVRDMRVQALTEIATGAFFHTPIGDGHVPVGAMLEVLANAVTDPEQLFCCLKVITRPEHDVEAWLRASIATVRDNHGRYWSV